MILPHKIVISSGHTKLALKWCHEHLQQHLEYESYYPNDQTQFWIFFSHAEDAVTCKLLFSDETSSNG